MDGVPCVLCFFVYFLFHDIECVCTGGAPFPPGAQLHGEERERGLLHQGHFLFLYIFLKNFVFKNIKNKIKTLIIPKAQTTRSSITGTSYSNFRKIRYSTLA